MRPLAALFTILSLTASSFAQTPPTTQPGRSIPLKTGTLFVAEDLPSQLKAVNVLVHFHGAPASVQNSFIKAGLGEKAVLVNVTFKGLSRAYSEPFKDPALFGQVLDDALATLKAEKLVADDAAWGKVCVSSFSAGYGAVREILKDQNYFDRIDALLLADSLYASYEDRDGQKKPAPEQMKDFRRFAQAAADGKKVMIVTHSQLVPGSYASTIDTTDDLIAAAGAKRAPMDRPGPGDSAIVSAARQGSFRVVGVSGTDGEAHMLHLRHIDIWLAELPLRDRDR